MYHREKCESVIPFIPGSSFSEVSTKPNSDSDSESIDLSNKPHLMHSTSSSALSDFNFAVPLSTFVLSRNNPHRYAYHINPLPSSEFSTFKRRIYCTPKGGVPLPTYMKPQNLMENMKHRISCNDHFKNVLKPGVNSDLQANTQSIHFGTNPITELKKALEKIVLPQSLIEQSDKSSLTLSSADQTPQPIIEKSISESSNLNFPCVSSQDQDNPQCSSRLEKISSNYPVGSPPKETAVRNSSCKMNLVKKGEKVFAIYFDDCYYPAVVIKVKRQLNLVTVSFDDGSGELDVPLNEVITLQLFQKWLKVSVKLSDGSYYDGDIYVSDFVNDQQFYCVNFTGNSRTVQRSFICFKKAHVDGLLRHDYEEIKKVITRGIKRKYPAEVPLLLSSSLNEKPPIFQNMLFLITAAEPNRKLDEGDERIDKNYITNLILLNGGEIITDIHTTEFQNSTDVVCISDGPSNSHIFLYCVVVGIPVLHYEWVEVSLEREDRQSYLLYVVPAGVNLENETIEQDYSKRKPYDCLNSLRIYVHQDAKKDTRDFDLVLSKAGCIRVAPRIIVTDRTRILNFSRLKIDIILILAKTVPSVIWDVSAFNNIPILTYNWLVACLTTNRKVDVTASPLFSYKTLLSSQKKIKWKMGSLSHV